MKVRESAELQLGRKSDKDKDKKKKTYKKGKEMNIFRARRGYTMDE